MSAILESLLDDERRAECRANDGAMAMGGPIIRNKVHFFLAGEGQGRNRPNSGAFG